MAGNELDNTIDIPIQRTDLTAFDDTLSTMKEMFIAEMKRMDEEMNKFSSDLMRVYTQSSTLQAGAATKESYDSQNPPRRETDWESLVNSPLVEGEGDKKTLKLQFDVSQFDPAEVTVRVMNETLVVSASHEEKSDNSSFFRQYYREFKFPKGVDPCAVNSTLSKDGVLTIQAPLPHIAITADPANVVLPYKEKKSGAPGVVKNRCWSILRPTQYVHKISYKSVQPSSITHTLTREFYISNV